MISYRHFFVVLLVFVLACSSEKTVPANILAPDKMQALLWDLFRASNFVTSYQLPADTTLQRNKEQVKWYNRVLHLHQVTETQFKSSMQYYKTHPNFLATIMDSLSRKNQTPIVKPKLEAKRLE